MSRLFAPACVVVAAVILVVACDQSVAQQRRSPFNTSRVSLSTLEPIQQALQLTDEQKQLADSLHDELTEERNDIFQNSGGDFEAARVEYEEVTTEINAKFTDKLDDTQKTRLTEIFVQANGPNALADPAVIESLNLTEEQQSKLEDARQENRQAFFDSFQDFQDMSDEERREAFTKLQEEGDNRLLAGLTDEQKAEFGKLSGEEVDYDLSQLRGAFGGGGGGGRPAAAGETSRPQRPQ